MKEGASDDPIRYAVRNTLSFGLVVVIFILSILELLGLIRIHILVWLLMMMWVGYLLTGINISLSNLLSRNG